MATISVSLPADGDTIDVADYNTPVTTIVNAINGNLDNDNIAAAAAIAGTKLADSAITTVKIADEAVTPAKLLAGTGTDWVWQSWTPTWTNLTVGNGTASGAYMQIGKTVFARYSLVLGSTSSVSGAVSFAPPVTAVAYGTRVSIGTGIIDDVGSATYGCFVCFISTTSFAMYVNNSSTSDLLVQMSGTKPIAAYGTGDIVTFSMTYEAA